MTLWPSKSMGVLFGGVTDEERDEESLESVFHKEMFGYNLGGGGRWICKSIRLIFSGRRVDVFMSIALNLRKPKKKGPRRKKVKTVVVQPISKAKDDGAESDNSDSDSDEEEKVYTTTLQQTVISC